MKDCKTPFFETVCSQLRPQGGCVGMENEGCEQYPTIDAFMTAQSDVWLADFLRYFDVGGWTDLTECLRKDEFVGAIRTELESRK